MIEEFIVGDTLDEYIEKNDVSEEKIVGLMIQVCEAVKLLHRQTPAIIHRDIKPSNIIVDCHGRIKLIDLDAAREYDKGESKDTHILGTDGYAPPEQYGYAQTDERSDIYAIGSTLYEALFRKRLPRRGRNPIQKIVFSEDNKKVHQSLVKIIEKCTMFAPESRYFSVEMVEKELKHYKTKKLKKFACAAGIVLLFGIFALTEAFQDKESGMASSEGRQEAAGDAINSDTIDAKSITIDMENPTTGKKEVFTLYYKKDEPELSRIHIDVATYLGKKENPRKIRLENTRGHTALELKPGDWEYDSGMAVVTLKPSVLDKLKVGQDYNLIMEFSDIVLNAEVDVINDYLQITKAYSSAVMLEGGIAEVIRGKTSKINRCIANS